MKHDPRIKHDIFGAKTTYSSDYKQFVPDKRDFHTWPQNRTEPSPKKQKEYEEIDKSTYQKWRKDFHVPFNLLWQPNRILKSCPYDPIPDLVRLKFYLKFNDFNKLSIGEACRSRKRRIHENPSKNLHVTCSKPRRCS